MPFIIDEDEAIKAKCRGLEVTTQNGTKAVHVRFRLPEAEEAQVEYPYIAIELADVAFDPERAHRGGPLLVDTWEAGTDDYIGQLIHQDHPVPVTMEYNLVSAARSAWHDRQIMAAMLTEKFPPQWAYLFVPGDGTTRNVDLLDVQVMDSLDENRKRVFRKVYRVVVWSEFYPYEITEIQRVTSVSLTISHQLEPYLNAVPEVEPVLATASVGGPAVTT